MTLGRASLAFALGRDLLFAVVACATAVLISLSVQLDMTKQELRERSLAAAARDIAERLAAEPGGTVDASAASGLAKSAVYPTLAFDAGGRVLLQHPGGLEPELVTALSNQRRVAGEPERPGTVRFFQVAVEGRLIDGAVLQTGTGGDATTVEVYKDESSPDVLVDGIVREFPYRSARVLLPLFALLLFGSGCIVWSRMRPIAEVAAIAETIGPHTLNLRLPERNLPAEVLPIVRGVNAAFARLEEASEVQREFLRRAAHQLRTPMTVLSARAESLDDTEVAGDLRDDVKELARIVSQLLQLNEIDALPDEGDPRVDLGAVAQAVRCAYARQAERQETPIVLTAPAEPVVARGDPDVVEIAVRNLIENALQHAPARSKVELRVAPDASIAVADKGAGVPAALRDKIFEPFWSDGPRAGLGLTIVRRVAERYGASVSVVSGPNGGAVFSLHFRSVGSGDQAAEHRTLPAARRRQASLDGVAD